MTVTTKETAHAALTLRIGNEVDSDGHLVYIPIYCGKKIAATVSVYGHKDGGNGGVVRYPAPEARANAAHIVHCVNGWDTLTAERDALEAKVAQMRKALHELLDFDAHQPEPKGYTREHWTGLHRNAYIALGREVAPYCALSASKGGA